MDSVCFLAYSAAQNEGRKRGQEEGLEPGEAILFATLATKDLIFFTL